MKKLLTISIIAATLNLGCGTGTNVKVAREKLSSIKKIALLQTIFEKPIVDAQSLRQNLFTGMIADKFDKEFKVILPDLLNAEQATADAIRNSLAKKLNAELNLTLFGGNKLITTKEYIALTKGSIATVPIEPFSRDGFAFVQATGEKNFFKPVQGSFGGTPDEKFSSAIEGDEIKAIVKAICESLKVDGIAISVNQIGVTVYSNGSSAKLTSSLYLLDKNGDIALSALASKGESLQSGGDLGSFKTLLGHAEANADQIFANIKIEQTQK